MTSLVLLCEDQRSGPRQGFGFQDLMVSMLSDVLSVSRDECKKMIDCRPYKGAGNLLKQCGRPAQLIVDGNSIPVAIFDYDKIHRALGVDADIPDADLVDEIRRQFCSPTELRILFIKDNMESVLMAAARCFGGISEERLNAAVFKKDLEHRDGILRQMAYHVSREVRDCIKSHIPMFDEVLGLAR